jgi:hypothetical protein
MSPVETWRQIIVGPSKSWVLFKNGTCVIMIDTDGDLADRAVALMKEWGPVHPGSSAGDFGTIELPDGLGWVVTGHHNDILTLVEPSEVDPDASSLRIGLLGRSKRHQDAEDLQVLHVEDNRASPIA